MGVIIPLFDKYNTHKSFFLENSISLQERGVYYTSQWNFDTFLKQVKHGYCSPVNASLVYLPQCYTIENIVRGYLAMNVLDQAVTIMREYAVEYRV